MVSCCYWYGDLFSTLYHIVGTKQQKELEVLKPLLACPNKRCKGMLKFDYGNSFGAWYTCNACLKQTILPTKKQMKEFPERYWFKILKNGAIRVTFRQENKEALT